MATPVDAKLLKKTKFPPEFNRKVDMTKVNIEVMKKWIAKRISEILGNEDDVVIELCFNLLEGSRYPDIKALQINLTGFLDKDTPKFCKELWSLCLSGQENPQGVPKELLEAKKLELMQEKLEAERAAEAARREREEERIRERELNDMRRRERSGRGERNFGGRGRYNRRSSRSPPQYSRTRYRESRGSPRRRSPSFTSDHPVRSPAAARSPSRSPPRYRRSSRSPPRGRSSSRSPPRFRRRSPSPRRYRRRSYSRSPTPDGADQSRARRRTRSPSPDCKKRPSLDFDDRGRSIPRKEAPRSPISSDENKRPRLSSPNAASPEEKTRVPPPPTRPRRRGVRTGPTRRGAPGRKLGRKRGGHPGNVIDRGRDQNSPQGDEERPRRRSRTRHESPVDGGRQPITPVERPTAPINKALPSIPQAPKKDGPWKLEVIEKERARGLDLEPSSRTVRFGSSEDDEASLPSSPCEDYRKRKLGS